MAGNPWADELAGRRGRNRAAGKASFLHPGLVFLRRYLRDIISASPERNIAFDALTSAGMLLGKREPSTARDADGIELRDALDALYDVALGTVDVVP